MYLQNLFLSNDLITLESTVRKIHRLTHMYIFTNRLIRIFIAERNQRIMSSLGCVLYITINSGKRRRMKSNKYTVAFHAYTHAQHKHCSHYTSQTTIRSEEKIIVRRAEPAVDVSHVEQIKVPAACNAGGAGGGLVMILVVRRRQRAVAAAHLVPDEGAAVRRRHVAGARRGGRPVRGHGVTLRRRHPVGEDEALGLRLVIERRRLGGEGVAADVGVLVVRRRGAAAAVLDVVMVVHGHGWLGGAHGGELGWALGIGAALGLHHPLLQVRVPVVLHLVVGPPRQMHRNLRPPERSQFISNMYTV